MQLRKWNGLALWNTLKKILISKERQLNEDSVIPAWIAGIQVTWM
jgi:hypothetical protein